MQVHLLSLRWIKPVHRLPGRHNGPQECLLDVTTSRDQVVLFWLRDPRNATEGPAPLQEVLYRQEFSENQLEVKVKYGSTSNSPEFGLPKSNSCFAQSDSSHNY